MKKSSLATAMAVSMLVSALAAQAQTAVFTDTFGSSTLNGTSTPGGTPSASSTSYDVASTKTGSCALTLGSPGYLRVKLGGNTTAGYLELQALFANPPVQLVNVGDSVNLTFSFTNSAGTLLAGGNGSVMDVGLFNSGGSLPLAGSLNNAGLSGSTTYAVGNCTNWQGYVAQINYTGQTSSVYTRPVQTGTTSANQELVFSGAGTGLFNSPKGTQIGGTLTSAVTLTSGAKYTLSFTALLSASGTITIINNLYTGGDTSGTLISAQTNTTTGGTTYTNYANLFDGLSIGLANKGTSMNPQMDISQITISTNHYFSPAIAGLTNQTVIAGNNVSLSPVVTGNPAPAFQWQTNGVNIGNATSATLTLASVQYAQDGYVYSLIATNALGSVTNSMTLTVLVTPSITDLSDQAALVGDTVTISPTISGIPAPTLQWQTNGVNAADGLDANGSIIAGCTTGTLTITNVQLADGVIYSLVASNSAGLVTNSMNLTVASSPILPILTGPTNITVVQSHSGTFSASAAAVPLPVLQWLDQTQTPIPGATNRTLTLTNVQYSQNGYAYYFAASNSVGSVTNHATLTVIVPPAITSQPASLVVTNTQPASFTVAATGVPAVAYQWNKNGSPISSAANSTATNATFTIPSAAPGDMSANYSCSITNQAGVTNTVSVSLTVNSIMSATAFTPANGQTGVCYDAPLYVTFSQPPTMRTNGTIKIFNVTNSATPVDTINLALNNSVLGYQARSPFSGDGQTFNYYPVVITGSTLAIYPHAGVMVSNQTYYVTIDNGAFADSAGAYFAGLTANAWQFTTKPTGPADPVNPVVSADGSADFATVQGAVDSLATNAAGALRTINIKNGTYFEIVDIAGKTNVTLRGQSQWGTIIQYPNNANIAPGGTTHARMTFKVVANDVSLDNLMVTNSTPQGGGQAEALMIESNAKRCIVNNCEIASRQDTILANGSSQCLVYFNNTKILGNFDYLWGGGDCYFNQCVIHTISGTGGGNLTAARTDTSATASTNFPWLNPFGAYTANGFSYVACTFEADAGLGSITLAGSNGTSNNLVSWASCKFATNYVNPSASLFNGNYLFWEDQGNTDLTGTNPVSFSVLTTVGVTNNDPRLLAATNATTWLYGWTPQLAPNIIGQPTNRTTSAGQSVSFTVSATGIPDPSYQWQHAGTNLPGATSATLSIASAQRTDGGNYSVVVTNASGSVTSSIAVLTYNNTSPVANPATYTRNGLDSWRIKVSDLLTNATDMDGDLLTLVGVGTSTNGKTLVVSGGYVQYNNVNLVDDQFSYTCSDGFGGTNSAFITLLGGSSNGLGGQISSFTANGGTASMSFAGIPGYLYHVQVSTNLTDWSTLWTTNAPAGGLFHFSDSNAPQPNAYYRLMWSGN